MARKKDNDQQYAQLLAQLAIIFGGKCIKCECRDFMLFRFHHKNGGGAEDRKTSQAVAFLRKLLDECKTLDEPKDGIAMLCANCHAKEHGKVVRSVCLTMRRASTVLGMKPNELKQLVVEGAITPERLAEGSRANELGFTVQTLLEYAFLSDDKSAMIQRQVLGNKKDPARSERGRVNRLGSAGQTKQRASTKRQETPPTRQ